MADSVWVLCKVNGAGALAPIQAFKSQVEAEAVSRLLTEAGATAEMVEVPVWGGKTPTVSVMPPTHKPAVAKCQHEWKDEVCELCGEKL